MRSNSHDIVVLCLASRNDLSFGDDGDCGSFCALIRFVIGLVRFDALLGVPGLLCIAAICSIWRFVGVGMGRNVRIVWLESRGGTRG